MFLLTGICLGVIAATFMIAGMSHFDHQPYDRNAAIYIYFICAAVSGYAAYVLGDLF